MAATYYAQSEYAEPTMTVGQLIEHLRGYDPNDKVIFRSPPNGVYGPDVEYSIDDTVRVELERREKTYPAHIYVDDETGEKSIMPEEKHVFEAWSGVVIT